MSSNRSIALKSTWRDAYCQIVCEASSFAVHEWHLMPQKQSIFMIFPDNSELESAQQQLTTPIMRAVLRGGGPIRSMFGWPAGSSNFRSNASQRGPILLFPQKNRSVRHFADTLTEWRRIKRYPIGLVVFVSYSPSVQLDTRGADKCQLTTDREWQSKECGNFNNSFNWDFSHLQETTRLDQNISVSED
jgi:hypothetical protein